MERKNESPDPMLRLSNGHFTDSKRARPFLLERVTLDGGTLEVASDNSGDDTKNLQCALDFASEAGFRDIFLTSKTYNIGAVSATGSEETSAEKAKRTQL